MDDIGSAAMSKDQMVMIVALRLATTQIQSQKTMT